MTYIIMLPTFLIILLALYFTAHSGENPNGNILLGVTLPHAQLKNPDVLQIVKAYHDANLKYLYVFLLVLIPTYFVRNYISLTLMFLTMYCVLLFYVSSKVYMKYFKELYALKKQNEWFVGSTHVVSIDTEVSRLKGTFPVSKLWFIPSLVIAIIPILYPKNQGVLWISLICTVCIVISSFLIYRVVCKDKIVTYSENTDLNIALNCVYKREWSKCWVALSYCASIFGIAIFFTLGNLSDNMFYFIGLIIVSSLIPLLFLIFTYNKVRSTRNKLLTIENTTVYADDDEFWEKGYYYNPNDNRTLVEERMGIGMTTNMAKGGGKFTNIILIATVLLMVGMSVSFIPLDFGEINTVVEGDIVKISAPLYSYDFEIDSIINVTVLDSFPNSTKIKGANGDIFYTGSFSVNGYGTCKVYIYRKSDAFLLIELKDGEVFVNSSTKEKTKELYNKLINK